MKYREFNLSTGTKIFLGKDAESNDELVGEFKGKGNVILHTVAPGSPFCVIDKIDPSEKEIKESVIICASKSQDWRDNKSNVEVHQFTGSDVKKPFFAKSGTWKVGGKLKVISVKKIDIERYKKQI
ncbi:MAG: NFACT RNA binding domain-containing protein [Candidatus Pacearchaeota archaeon]|jgi:predicted ribosome quality control (RQC) complex YloA/Tae2 family protein